MNMNVQRQRQTRSQSQGKPSLPENSSNNVHGLSNTYNKKVLLCPDENFYYEQLGVGTRHPCKCDKSQFQSDEQKFDYSKFSTFLQAKSLIERQKRIRLIELFEPVLQVHDLTDDLLLAELTDIYGALDKKSKQFQKIFQTYKLERIEQIETWCSEEEIYILTNTKVTENESVDVCIDLSSLFNPKEVEEFERNTAYFVLPRPIPSIQEVSLNFTKKKPSLNIFDPEIHMQFVIPPICDVNVGESLAREIHKIIKKHPTGISCSQFVSEFEVLKSYRPNAQSMNYETFMEMIDDLSHHIILVQKCDKNTILHPMFLQGLICSLDEAFFEIFHKIKVILSMSYGIIKLSDSLKICEKVFGWENIDFKAWGFRSDQDFVLYLAKRWSTDKLVVVSEDQIIAKGDSRISYILQLTDERRVLFTEQKEKLNLMRKDKCPILKKPTLQYFTDGASSTSIPGKFMQPGQIVPNEMSNYRVGDVLFMTVTYYISPTDFYMVQDNMLTEIINLSKKLKMHCEREESINGPKTLMINPTLLLPGYCCILIDDDGEYHRAQYIKTEDGPLYKCRLLDYGDLHSVELKNLRYLDTKLGTKIPAQAFHCKLMDVVSPTRDKNGIDVWEESIKDFSYNLMVPNPGDAHTAKVFLKQFIVKHSLNQRQWVVWMCDRKRKIKDFGVQIMEFASKNSPLGMSTPLYPEKRKEKQDQSLTYTVKQTVAAESQMSTSVGLREVITKYKPNPFLSAVIKDDISMSLNDFPPLGMDSCHDSRSKSNTAASMDLTKSAMHMKKPKWKKK